MDVVRDSHRSIPWLPYFDTLREAGVDLVRVDAQLIYLMAHFMFPFLDHCFSFGAGSMKSLSSALFGSVSA